MPSATSSRPMVCCFSELAMKSSRFLNRNVPAFVIRFTMQRPGIRAARRPIARRGRGALEELVWSLMVVLGAEAVEGALLGRQRGAGRPNRFGLERLVHPFVGAVLLRRRGSNTLMLNAEPEPPDIELRQAVNPGRRERDPIVGANRVRQAVLAEQP